MPRYMVISKTPSSAFLAEKAPHKYYNINIRFIFQFLNKLIGSKNLYQ